MLIDIFDASIELDESFVSESSAVIRCQVRQYAAGERQRFELEVHPPEGFLGEVMKAMGTISFGRTSTYGALAADLATAPIAVGQACARNPLPLIVPCHRVVASDGTLGGYSGGDGIATKRKLLRFEASA